MISRYTGRAAGGLLIMLVAGILHIHKLLGYDKEGFDKEGNDKAFYAEKIRSIKETEDLKTAFRTALFCLITHWQGENYCHNHIKKDLETCLQCNIISHELAEKIKSERSRENLDELISDIKYFC